MLVSWLQVSPLIPGRKSPQTDLLPLDGFLSLRIVSPPSQRTLGKKANVNETQNLEFDLTRNPLPSGGVSAALSSLKLKELRSCFSTQASVFTEALGFSSLSPPPLGFEASQSRALNSKCAEFNFSASVLARE